MGDTYVVTGGYVSSSYSQLVAMYDQSGKFTYLPNLRYKRAYHACSHFINANGDTVSPILNVVKYHQYCFTDSSGDWGTV